MVDEQAIEFLKESNNIEDEWDDDSLAQALYAWNYITSEKELTPSVVLKTHKILMLHHLGPQYKGKFRDIPIWIGGREVDNAPNLPDLIAQWCENIKFSKTEEQIKADHVKYEGIHPFVDGNGRTGRIFMNWQRVKNGLPILVVKESEKWQYYNWFKRD